MHGRLKLKTSAQQAAEKKAARDAKVKMYQGAMCAVLSHRDQHDVNQLKMTSGLLIANPDITTLWNIRKDSVENIMKTKTGDEKFIKDLLRHEMEIAQECLMVNPKSYGAWHHRAWCLLQNPYACWDVELNLCELYLKQDDRNFHCWDHRRFVVSKADVSPEDELSFTTERINSNFSNYSAWHYRSKILPQVNPPKEGENTTGVMSESSRREELDYVQNAAFTDPDDSSAWYYHKWLLLGGKSQRIAEAYPTMLAWDVEKKRLFVTFSSLTDPSKSMQLIVDGIQVDKKSLSWKAASSDEPTDTLWILKHQPLLENANSIEIQVDGLDKIISVTRENPVSILKLEIQLRPEPETKKVLEGELANCNELVELEPDSKWARYAKIHVMSALQHHKYFDQILDELTILSNLDNMRTAYYSDTRSKFLVEDKLKGFEKELDLSGLDLTCLYHKERFSRVETLDLAQNKLRSIDTLVPYLVQCRKLILDDNPIETLDLSGLDDYNCLKEVSIRGTPLALNDGAVKLLEYSYLDIKFTF